MPGFYGLITKNDSCHSDGNFFDIINSNLFINQWSSKNNIDFLLHNAHIDLGIISLHKEFTEIRPPENLPEIYFEGYIYEISGLSSVPGDYFKLQSLLKELYYKDGHQFLNKIHGSFTMVIIDSDCISLITDHTYSRPIYFFKSDNFFAWSPETFPLITAFKKFLTLNIGNIGQILCSEFSFIDNTIVNEITCLRPGEILTYQNSKIERKYYFRFKYDERKFESGLFASKRLTQRLNNRIKEVISKQWAIAPSPAIMLSGGLDSRYIVSSIAEIVNDTSKLTLVTWSIPDPKRYSDLDISKRIAQKLGAKHIILQRSLDNLINELDQIYKLIGCEVDSIFHAHETSLISTLRKNYGIESLFRGEETFGWGQYRRNLKYALNQIIISYPEDNPLLKKIFQHDTYRQLVCPWHQKLRDILNEYSQNSINELKDSLYFNWRLSRYLSTLSYFKLAYMEQFNPLLDLEILKINSIIPSRLRIEKKIFRKAYKTKSEPLKNLPFATMNSLEDWVQVIRTNKKIFNYVRENLSIENNCFQNSSSILDYLLINTKNQQDEKNRLLDYFRYEPFLKENYIFKIANKIRHLFVKPPSDTVPIKLIFRAAIVKDFITRYLGQK